MSLLLLIGAPFPAFVAPSPLFGSAYAPRAGLIVASAPSPPPAVDLRRQGLPTPPAATDKYGHDPRDGLSGDELAPDGSFDTAAPGQVVDTLSSVGQLQAALDAAGREQVVVIKFMRTGCLACASTVESYKATARSFGDAGQFYEVNFDDAKPFCRAAGVKFVPSGHVYKDGALLAALPLGKKAWDAFAEKLDQTRGELQ